MVLQEVNEAADIKNCFFFFVGPFEAVYKCLFVELVMTVANHPSKKGMAHEQHGLRLV